MKYKSIITMSAIAGLFIGCGNGDDATDNVTKTALGNKLFHDTTLSANETMSCATCHDLDSGLIDPRTTNKTIGASLGDNGFSIGDRNAPTAGYASFSPDFHFDAAEGLYMGGQFLDGRALNLKEQAKGPFLNPLEMGMPDAASVVAKVQANESYVTQFKTLYGENIFDDTDAAYDALADAISEFEKGTEFSSFDSKYDKFIAGTYTLTDAEARGMAIYTNENDQPGAGRCTLCHPIAGEKALMTDFSYDNLGVPVNTELRTENGQAGIDDEGLYKTIQSLTDLSVGDRDGLKGAFKVSSLRNIAVTGPYMHNGKFKDLATVVHFYNTRDKAGATNPEAGGALWETGEFHAGRNTDELGDLGLSVQDENDLVTFMKTFTDERYEHLLP